MSASSLAKTPDARARRLRAIEAIAVMGMNQREAAAYAGIKPDTVSKLMQMPQAQRYIKDIQDSNAKKLNVSRERVMEGILSAIDHARMVNEPGTELRGWEQISKMQGFNAPERHIHELSEDTEKFLTEMREMQDEDLYRLTESQNIIELTEDDYKKKVEE